MENELRFAVLIDADNISDKYIDIILGEAAGNGIITYKRIYGDWTSPKLSSWKKVLLENSIIPMQQYGYTTGKNATDSAMIIDAMDILYSKTVDGFCLVSSDSDFTRLAARLRESGMQVIGMGEIKTPQPFISACNQFKYLDRLFEKENEKNSKKNAVNPQMDKELLSKEQLKAQEMEKVKNTIKLIIENYSDDEGWIFSGKLGDQLSKRIPEFDVRNYGYSKLTVFLESLGEYESNKLSLGNHQKQIYFRLKKEEKENPEKNNETGSEPGADESQEGEAKASKKSGRKSGRRRGRRGSRRSGGKK